MKNSFITSVLAVVVSLSVNSSAAELKTPVDGSSMCGPGYGSCPDSCCSEFGRCGTSADYCGGSQCQLEYSHTCETFLRHDAKAVDSIPRVGPGGSDTSHIPRPRVGNVAYGPLISSCKEPGMVALTFDDGPYDFTSDLLDILDKANAKATFFITGSNYGRGHIDSVTGRWPGILRRMHRAGHHISSHTWTHRNLDQISDAARHAEIYNNEMALRNIFGWIPTYFRPPFLDCGAGSACQGALEAAGYHSISTNLDSKDFMYDDPALIQQSKDRIASGLSSDAGTNSYIILCHDVHEQTVYNLTSFVVNLARERGYRLVTVGECLGDPRENWYRPA
ncbi:hypothetical protein C2857_006856 [Epichloe festucae Fl1]|uniref:Chitin deacetylase n=1 Tax=Epichloe festucae (strain Fl1) TaxID=877507 RepID=A0A7S9PWB1_EPIFF|nr:hypothetical protein C2857_006856 [Epichloe festucae Fl1]